MDDLITIKPSVNKKFVELYLAHELSSKEFNRLYGANMEALGTKGLSWLTIRLIYELTSCLQSKKCD